MNTPAAEINELDVLFDANKFEKGLGHARKLLHEYPYCGVLWQLCGRFYHQLGLLRLSQSALEVATTITPLSADSQIALADCYIDSGHNSVATLIYENLIEMGTLSECELINITKCLESLKEYKTAAFCLQHTEGYIPGIAIHHFQLAQYMADSGYPVSIIEKELKEAIVLDPACIDYRIGLASFLHCTNRYKEAYYHLDNVQEEYIEAMSCECCLKKMISIFTYANDFKRLDVCRVRLDQLCNF